MGAYAICEETKGKRKVSTLDDVVIVTIDDIEAQANVTGFMQIDYPEGFNYSNCYVESAMYKAGALYSTDVEVNTIKAPYVKLNVTGIQVKYCLSETLTFDARIILHRLPE